MADTDTKERIREQFRTKNQERKTGKQFAIASGIKPKQVLVARAHRRATWNGAFGRSSNARFNDMVVGTCGEPKNARWDDDEDPLAQFKEGEE